MILTRVNQILRASAIAIAFAGMATIVSGQSANEYFKVEVSAGYSHMRAESTVGTEVLTSPFGTMTVDPCSTAGAAFFGANFQRFFCARRGFNGFDASIAYNFHKYVGVKGNISGHFNSETFVDGPTTEDSRSRIYNFLAGLQLKDNRKEGGAFRPFAHALFGAARVNLESTHTSPPAPPPFNSFTTGGKDTSFAMKLGGGLDVRISEHIDVRVIEFNYNPIFGGERTLSGGPFPALPQRANGRTANNFSIGFGIALH
jgi:opacity protein-like surface antigen